MSIAVLVYGVIETLHGVRVDGLVQVVAVIPAVTVDLVSV
jgi:hypothetical protein